MKGQLTDDCGREAREPVSKNKKSGPGFPAAAAAPVYPSFRDIQQKKEWLLFSRNFFRFLPGRASQGSRISQTD
jgi:hypothetical protein